MYNRLPIEECSISQIYLDSPLQKRYSIPIYQRNYAWTEEQIEALILDVYNAFSKSPNSIYYIGTLVTYSRSESEFEVIDGQQRLTTIYLILKRLGINPRNTLTYTARSVAAQTLNALPEISEGADRAIVQGYNIVDKKLEEIVDRAVLDKFKSYFLHNVHIIYYRVPKDVDLNHYFEVMNSRGEQLEMHEIVKAMLSEPLASDTESRDMAIFNTLWEACSQMNVYVQHKLHDSKIFGSHLDKFCIASFEDIDLENDIEQKQSILSLLESTSHSTLYDNSSVITERFQPIIDFPNLLLIVLKLTLEGEQRLTVALNDKELLGEFKTVWKAIESRAERADFARKFAYNLLKAKYLLDNYIVHHDMTEVEQLNSNPWKLAKYDRNGETKQLCADDKVQTEIVHLLSMFEVTFTAKQNKNYLFYCLDYLFNRSNVDELDYLGFLQQLADKYFYDIYLKTGKPTSNAFDDAVLRGGELELSIDNCATADSFNKVYQEGSDNIPLYIFNYTDYRLWKIYAEELRGRSEKVGSTARNQFFAKLGCTDFGLIVFDNFYFSRTRKSLEHYYPQSKAIDGSKDTDYALCHRSINCFGNFAMISSEANSSGNNLDAATKLIRYSDRGFDAVSVASLKFKIMMQICRDNRDNAERQNGMQWNKEDMQKHQNAMLRILFSQIITD